MFSSFFQLTLTATSIIFCEKILTGIYIKTLVKYRLSVSYSLLQIKLKSESIPKMKYCKIKL